MVYTATARWDFRGETLFFAEIEASSLDVAGAVFYSMLPITFFRGKSRLISIRPQQTAWCTAGLVEGKVATSRVGGLE